jgi:hypothetical protein
VQGSGFLDSGFWNFERLFQNSDLVTWDNPGKSEILKMGFDQEYRVLLRACTHTQLCRIALPVPSPLYLQSTSTGSVSMPMSLPLHKLFKFIVCFGRPNLPSLSLCPPVPALLGYDLLCSYLLLSPLPRPGPRGKRKTRAFHGIGDFGSNHLLANPQRADRPFQFPLAHNHRARPCGGEEGYLEHFVFVLVFFI